MLGDDHEAGTARLLEDRQAIRAASCVAVRDDGRIVVATWCLPLKHSRLRHTVDRAHHDEAGEVAAIFVLPEARGLGLAGKLCKALLHAAAWRGGIVWFVTQVRSDRIAAVRLNERLGFLLAASEQRLSVAGRRRIRVYRSGQRRQ